MNLSKKLILSVLAISLIAPSLMFAAGNKRRDIHETTQQQFFMPNDGMPAYFHAISSLAMGACVLAMLPKSESLFSKIAHTTLASGGAYLFSKWFDNILN